MGPSRPNNFIKQETGSLQTAGEAFHSQMAELPAPGVYAKQDAKGGINASSSSHSSGLACQSPIVHGCSSTDCNDTTFSPHHLEIAWWNVCHLASPWPEQAFWDFLEKFDIVFLLETHHGFVPSHPGLETYGVENNLRSRAAGVLALVRLA